jgi:hypothetical protein
MFMLVTLDTYQQSPAGNRFKFAETIRTEFQFESTGADVSPFDGRMILRVFYLTKKDSKYDPAVQRKEMEDVAAFAAKSYDGKDRSTIQEIQIQRTEVRGRGCFQKTLQDRLTAEPPADWKTRKGTLPSFLDRPEEPARNP